MLRAIVVSSVVALLASAAWTPAAPPTKKSLTPEALKAESERLSAKIHQKKPAADSWERERCLTKGPGPRKLAFNFARCVAADEAGRLFAEPFDLRSSGTVRDGISGEAVTADEKQEKR